MDAEKIGVDKKKIIVVAAVLIAVLAVFLWYYIVGKKSEGLKEKEAIPLTSEEKRTILKDLSVPEGDVLPDVEKQKILKELSAPASVVPSVPSASMTESPQQVKPEISNQEKLKLLESLKNQ